MMAKLKDVLGSVGETTTSYASRIGCRTSALARRVGPKRGGIALGVLAIAIGTPFLIRWLKARNADASMHEPVGEQSRAKPRRRRSKRSHAPTAQA